MGGIGDGWVGRGKGVRGVRGGKEDEELVRGE